MQKRIIEIDLEIAALDKEKKNFARRINYRIKKLKTEKDGLLKGLEDPDLAPLDFINHPEDWEAREKEFELVKEDAEYDIFFKKCWRTLPFLELVPGNFLRVRVEGKVKEIRGIKIFECTTHPYANFQRKHAVRVKQPDLPIRSIKEEIASHLKGARAPQTELPASY